MKPHIFHIHQDRVMQHVKSAHSGSFVKGGPGTGITAAVAVNQSMILKFWCIIETGGSLQEGRAPGKPYIGDGRIFELCNSKREAKDLLRAYNRVKPSMSPHLTIEKRWCYIAAGSVDDALRPIDEHLRRAEELVAEYAALEGTTEKPKPPEKPQRSAKPNRR